MFQRDALSSYALVHFRKCTQECIELLRLRGDSARSAGGRRRRDVRTSDVYSRGLRPVKSIMHDLACGSKPCEIRSHAQIMLNRWCTPLLWYPLVFVQRLGRNLCSYGLRQRAETKLCILVS